MDLSISNIRNTGPRTFGRKGNVIRIVTAPHSTGLSVGAAYSLILMRHNNDKRDD